MPDAPDRLACAMAREMATAPFVAVGMATTLPLVAALLAKRVHRPDLRLVTVVGGAIVDEEFPARLVELEAEVLKRAVRCDPFAEAVFRLLPDERPLEFFRPGQLDRRGRSNNLRIGDRWLPGPAGLPDVTAYADHVHYYFPRHTPRALVPRVDAVSGAIPPRLTLLTDLARLELIQGQLMLAQVYDGVREGEVQAATGYPLTIVRPLGKIPDPSPEEARALADIDPLGLRRLEFLRAEERLAQITRLVS